MEARRVLANEHQLSRRIDRHHHDSGPTRSRRVLLASERDRLARGVLRSLLEFYGDPNGGAPSQHAGLTAP